MFKLLLALVATFSTSYAAAITCSCAHNFTDFLGSTSQITLHVECPTTIIPDIDCYGVTEVQSEYTVVCASIEDSTIRNETKMSLQPMTKPEFSYSTCRLSDD